MLRLVRASCFFANISRLNVRVSLLPFLMTFTTSYKVFPTFVTTHVPCAGPPILSHMCTDATDYTYKFVSSFSIITTQVSPSCLMTSSLINIIPTPFQRDPSPLRRLQTTPEPHSKIFLISPNNRLDRNIL